MLTCQKCAVACHSISVILAPVSADQTAGTNVCLHPTQHHLLLNMQVVAIAAGGVLYSIGAFVYAARWPDPFPQWFGFHEVFHALVVMASICHFGSMYYVLVKMGPQFAAATLTSGMVQLP